MGIFRYLSHPQVDIDPERPIPDWSLSAKGRARAAHLAGSPIFMDTKRILTSPEVKARETADILAATLGMVPEIVEDSYENDRSATGFLPPPEFERMANEFFANPDKSVRGWEPARDAQARIVTCIYQAVMSKPMDGDILCVGHGGVGTLLYCDVAGLAISRGHDQRNGGGCLFAFDMQSDEVLHGWHPLEAFTADALK